MCVLAPAFSGVAQAQPNGPSLTIDLKSAIAPVSPLLYGLMTEEINHSYDGGLYAELMQNRAFLDDASTPANWSIVANAPRRRPNSTDEARERKRPRWPASRGHRGHKGPARGRREQRLLGHPHSCRDSVSRLAVGAGRGGIHRPGHDCSRE